MNGHVFGRNFKDLCKTLSGIDLMGSRPPEPPWKTERPKADDVETWVAAGVPAIPSVYRNAFIEPLRRGIPKLVADYAKDESSQSRLETLVCAVYQHTRAYRWRPHLHRFLALVSDLYRPFVERRAALTGGKTGDGKIEIAEILPPLATFKYSGTNGPFTFAWNEVHEHIGGSVAVVSLPAVYADHPILWVWIAHETGGHDVVHAVPGLLKELQVGIQQELAAMSVRGLWPGEIGSLWSYWMNEAVADVYGVLNIGPMFCPGVTAATAALRHQRDQLPIPHIWMSSDDASGTADPHPTDILRIHLALGVVEALIDLDPNTQLHYAAMLKMIADLCTSADVVRISGYPLYDGRRIDAIMPLGEMQESARRAGRYIATAELKALGNRSIQEIETWDDRDERGAEDVRQALAAEKPIDALGDDAQLFAGAIMHVLGAPAEYDRVNAALVSGLNQSFANDQLWRSDQRGADRSGLAGAAAKHHGRTP